MIALNIILKPAPALAGEVVVTAYPVVKGKLVVAGAVSSSRKCFWNILGKEIFPPVIVAKVYPNPVRSNTTITVDLQNHSKGDYALQLLTVTGQVIMSQERHLGTHSGSINILIPSLTSGTYILKVVNKKTGKALSEKIIVQ